MTIPDDIAAALAHYPSAERERARAIVVDLLAARGSPECHRVVRCVLHLANTNLAALADAAAAAKLDWRDVVYWAEYEGGVEQVRDFTKPMR